MLFYLQQNFTSKTKIYDATVKIKQCKENASGLDFKERMSVVSGITRLWLNDLPA